MLNVIDFKGWSIGDFLEDAFWRGWGYDRDDWDRFVQIAHRAHDELNEKLLNDVYQAGIRERERGDAWSS